MQIGVNYPWLDYGWDFGLAPPSWRPPGVSPRWYGSIDADLRRLRRLGVTVVRWFILGDGLSYGNGLDAPLRNPASGRWHFLPPPLDPEVLLHFEELLRRVADTQTGEWPPIQLLPVLVDFHFCKSGAPVCDGWVKAGRADVVADPARRRMFFDRVLEPLLRVSEIYRPVIYAWEVINEPEWVTLNWRPLWQMARAVEESSMRAFLEEGQVRIRSAGFRPTIGFAAPRTIVTSGITSDINQFHHYPAGRRPLVAPFTDRPAIVGEIATTIADGWPEHAPGAQSLIARLTLLEELGYDLAMLWSFRARDRHSDWSPEVERDLERFAQRGGNTLA